MFDRNEKFSQETDFAFAVAVALLNASALAATFGVGWLTYWLIEQSNQLEFFLRIAQAN